ncbi:hypothetical protein VB779_10740 [Haloarculaceae archaeon H-GB11]|nr:hypothetical protein [Haloarculaceae archaeon H-GB11]
MTDRAITGIGVAVPRGRIDADTIGNAWGRFEATGIDATAVPAGDEDALTLGVEAGERASRRPVSTAKPSPHSRSRRRPRRSPRKT